MAVGDAHVFPCFLTPVLTLHSFQSNRLLFSHALAEVRGENTPERKVALNRVSNSQPPGQESYTLTTEPLGRGCLLVFSSFPVLFVQKFISDSLKEGLVL